ncbi:hypothetical protein Tco_1448702 [Tanacetum coccineum]
MVTDPPPANSTVMPAPRKKLDSEFNDEENKLEMADTQAEIILSQGLPRHIFNILNQTSTAKEIWDNVECFMQDQIYTQSQSLRPHAKRLSQKHEPTTKYCDPLAYVAHTASAPVLSSSSTSSPQPTAQSSNDALMATMTQIANLLSGFQKQFPPTNNQLRTSSNSKTHATMHDGQIVTEPIQEAPRQCCNTGVRRQEAKEKGDVLDAEAEAFLADVECFRLGGV